MRASIIASVAIVVALILLVVVPLFASIAMWTYHDYPVTGYVPYTGDHGVQYRIFTIQTPSGPAKITVTCTYYDNATTLPVQDQIGWYWGSVTHSYVLNPPKGVSGC